MAAQTHPATAVTTTMVIRRPVHEYSGRTTGFAVRFGGADPADRMTHEDDITAAVLDVFSRVVPADLFGVTSGYLALPRDFICGRLPVPVRPEVAAILIGPEVLVDDELLTGVAGLVRSGYRFALHDYRGSGPRDRLLPLVEEVTIEVGLRSWPAVLADADRALSHGARLMATGVHTEVTLESCGAAGFTLFEGTWLVEEASLTIENLSPSQSVALDLVGRLSDPDTSMAEIEHLVRTSPELAYRLLRIANSASSGSQREVGSLHDAIVMVGVARLRSWLMLLSLSTTPASQYALADALVRASMAEQVARRTRSVAPEAAFTTGLLHGVAEALSVPPTELLQHIPALAHDLAEALLGAPGALRTVLEAVVRYQNGRLDEGFDPTTLVDAYLTALAWTTRTLSAV